MQAKATIEFDHKGIGKMLDERFLRVPPNQREYAWESEHVDDLFRDLADSERKNEPEYFLGLIVLTRKDDGSLWIADGQQRLATTTILLAAIRDYLRATKSASFADQLDNRFLQTAALGAHETAPKLRLNTTDDEFFRKRILSQLGSPDRKVEPVSASHRRIADAAERAAVHVKALVATVSREYAADALMKTAVFINDRATVVIVTAPDDWGAFRMFETLNDRGLEAAQSDLVKNYLLSLAKDRIAEVQQRWAAMIGALESAGEQDVVKYLRHYFIISHGHVREHQLFDRIREQVKTSITAMEFTDSLAACAKDYVALRRPDDDKWTDYGSTTRQHIETLRMLRAEQLRPILLAVARAFPVPEAKKAFRLFVACAVRLLVGGGSKLGRIDRECNERAAEVGTGKITTAKQLAARMAEIIPNDAEFVPNFAVASVARADVARYVLRSLEQRLKNESDPELVPNDNQEAVNLEHVLPLTPGPGWSIDPDTAAALNRRLGNMVLLKLAVNKLLGSDSFDAKKEAYKKSTFALTSEVGAVSTWTAHEIAERQKKMAAVAVSTWPITAS